MIGIFRGHRGATHVESEVNVGTSVRVLLPISAQKAVTDQPRPEFVPLPSIDGTALVVEDEALAREAVQEMLERLRFRVLTAMDGLDGVQTFRDHASEISFVLLDMTMPHMDGVEACGEIRRIRDDAKVILTSGYHERETKDRLREDGFVGYLQKPFQTQDLQSALSRVLS